MSEECGTFQWLASKCSNHSLLETLSADPETDKYAPNRKSRQVKSGHYVEVKPTPLRSPYLVAYSPVMALELGLSEAACQTDDFVRFFSGDVEVAPGFRSWCTPYALSIMGEEMYRQCPFQNGNGYGDGRAISVGEVLTESGQRWELQLKGAGPTPFCRGADGRAVIRSSVREFLAQEAMHAMGVSTTRSLSLIASGADTVRRQWYSAAAGGDMSDMMNDPRLAHMPLEMRKMLLQQLQQQGGQNPDIEIDEACAITCRVAPSFLRVGQVELFGRRARKGVNHQELEMIVEHVIAREFCDCIAPEGPFQERALAMLEQSAARIQQLTADWIRVGFAQGNFNSDNCLVGGRTMDYGPFGFVEKYRPNFALWVGSGQHFAFINQPSAGFANFKSLAGALVPLLDDEGVQRVEAIIKEYQPAAKAAVDDVWRRKLGFSDWGATQEQLWRELHGLMEASAPDYTILWRELASLTQATDPAVALESLQVAFYEPLQQSQHAAWAAWLGNWLKQLQADPMPAADRVAQMKLASPKYVPREWILAEVYKAAIAGDMSPLHEAQQLFANPFDEQPEMEARFYRKCPSDLLQKGGIAHMT